MPRSYRAEVALCLSGSFSLTISTLPLRSITMALLLRGSTIVIVFIAFYCSHSVEAFFSVSSRTIASDANFFSFHDTLAFARGGGPKVKKVKRNTCINRLLNSQSSPAAEAVTWRCSAEIVPDTTSTSADDTKERFAARNVILSSDSNNVDASPRLWMENIEATEGYGGAYTVIRSELIRNTDGENIWKVWGQEFHLERLKSSFAMQKNLIGSNIESKYFQEASKESEELIATLLDQANAVLLEENETDSTKQVVMLTILWTDSTMSTSVLDTVTSSVGRGRRIRVRAHGSLASVPAPRYKRLSESIQVAVALPPIIKGSGDGEVEMSQREWVRLPSRHDNYPQAKDSTWCRERRPLEEVYKVDGVGEIILARKTTEFDGMELLEGLTSNLFVIYNDGTIRTAKSGSVLDGYARALVLEAAKEIGVQYYESKPVILQDAIDGKWAETFITSSIRLMVPCRSMLVPEDMGDVEGPSFKQVWSCSSFSDNKSYAEKIYEEILRSELG